MAVTNYSPLLGLALPTTGDLAGTWGDVVNDSITSLLDTGVAGTTTISTDADVTLTTTNGAANQARSAILLWTASGTTTRNITAPAQSKAYVVLNATGGTQSIVIRGAGPTTGVTIKAGEKALVAWNGSDFVKVSTAGGDGVFTSVTDSELTSGRVTYATTGGLLTDSANLTFNGTTLTANTLNLTNALTTAYGGTGLTSYTAGDLPYYASGTALSKLAIGSSTYYLSSSGTAPQWTAPAALTKTDDTNVTLTLGGNASTALLRAASLTLGWTGQLGISRGGTGIGTYTAGDMLYFPSAGTTLTTLALGTSGQVLTSSGTAPQWSTLSGVAVTTFSAGTTGFTPNTATSGAVTLAGTLATTNGGTGLTSFTANGVVYASSTSALATGSALTFDGTNLGIGTSSPISKLDVAAANTAVSSRGIEYIYSTDSFAVDKGGQLSLGGSYTGTTQTFFAAIAGRKENATDADVAGYLQFATRVSGGAMAEKMRLDSSGNLGLGVTPSAWATVTALQVKNAHIGGLSNTGYIGANAYYNGGWKYIATDYATRYEFDAAHKWFIAASGTAGNAITFTQAMTLDASGNLGVGITSPAVRLHVSNSSLSGTMRVGGTSGTYYGELYKDDSTGEFRLTQKDGGIGMTFYTGASPVERMRLDTQGNLGLGVTPSAWATADSRKAIQLPAGSVTNYSTTELELLQNGYVNSSGNYIYVNNGYATRYSSYLGAHRWFTAPSGTAGNAITFTQAMTLDASGNLGIGTTSPGGKLDVYGASAAIVNSANNGQLTIGTNTGTSASTLIQGPSYIAFSTYSGGWAERMRIDSSGNLGIGVAPSAWNAGKVLELGGRGSFVYGATAQTFVGTNAYYNSGWKYAGNYAASKYEQGGGAHSWFTAASGTAGNAITFTQAMTLDASGNLLVGTTSSYWSASGRGVIELNGTSSALFGFKVNATNAAYIWQDGTDWTFNNQKAGAIILNTNNTERARIDSNGNLLVGTTSTNGTGFTFVPDGGTAPYMMINMTTATGIPVYFRYSGSNVGTISTTTTSTSYNTSSDARLKENIVAADDSAPLIDALQVRQFDWKADGSHQRYGFVAQELDEVYPEAVSKPADPAEMMGVDYSKLVPLLVAELQSLRARVAQLESKGN